MVSLDEAANAKVTMSGPLRKPIVVMGERGPSNPSPDDVVDEYWLTDYWFYPPFFDIEFVGENKQWDDHFVEGEMGALKRHLLLLAMNNTQSVNVDPFSIYVCIENLQRYYKKRIKNLEEACLKMPITNGTQESTTETP